MNTEWSAWIEEERQFWLAQGLSSIHIELIMQMLETAYLMGKVKAYQEFNDDDDEDDDEEPIVPEPFLAAFQD